MHAKIFSFASTSLNELRQNVSILNSFRTRYREYSLLVYYRPLLICIFSFYVAERGIAKASCLSVCGVEVS